MQLLIKRGGVLIGHEAGFQDPDKGAESYERRKSEAHAYASKRQCSVQEAVYRIMPELWL